MKSNAEFGAVMAVELLIASEAESDLAEAYGWYEAQRIGLGEEFLGCVDACIETVMRSPEMYAVVQENYRRALVRRFPYAVFYEHCDGVVTIYCVFHTARDPEKWRRRLT
jgi:plasmid stabilization system protein ParE